MTFKFFEHQETIAENIIIFMRLKGYSRMSLSKLTNIPRSDIEQILESDCSNPILYNSHLNKIMESFDLLTDYFLKSQVISITPHTRYDDSSGLVIGDQRTEKAQNLLDGLENILEIYSMYLK